MSVAVRLVGFAVVLVLCFGGAYAVGTAVGPVGDPPVQPPMQHGAEHGG
jgi:hypothetical protein